MKLDFRHVCLMILVFLFFSGTASAANYVVGGATGTNANGVYANHPMPSVDVPPNDDNWWKIGVGAAPNSIITLAPANIPSLSTWGILIMLTVLIGIAIAVIRKSRFPDTGARV